MTISLQSLHKSAREGRWAVPHFNISTFEQLSAIVQTAQELKAPILIGTSEGERRFLGEKQVVYAVKSFRDQNLPIFLNADHCHSTESAIKAFKSGFDSVHIDLSKEPFQKNIEGTKKVVETIKSKTTEVEVEAELGYLVTDSSKIYKEKVVIPEESYTKIEEAKEFVQKTKIDRFAPAIGNLHGIAANKPLIKFELIEKLREALPKDLTFTLHGGSGISSDDLAKIVKLGFNNVHISTELRSAFTDALRTELQKLPDEITPYKYLEKPQQAVSAVVAQKLKLYNAIGKAT